MEVPDVVPPVVSPVVLQPVVSSPVPRAKFRAGDLVSLCVEDSALGIKYDQAIILGVRRTCQVFIYFPYLRSTLSYLLYLHFIQHPEPDPETQPETAGTCDRFQIRIDSDPIDQQHNHTH